MKRVLLALALVGLGVGAAYPQVDNLTGGVFIFHSPPGLVYTDTEDYCATYATQWAIRSCDQQNPRVDSEDITVWYVLAAWDSTKHFCGVEFGLGAYDPDICGFVDNAQCPASAQIIPYGAWPGPGTGVSMAAAGEPWDGNFIPVYFFAAYAYAPGLVPLSVHPGTGFGGFANCLTPPTSYPAYCFGAMGLFMPGVPCCPVYVPQHVCCVGEECYLVSEEECAGMGGEWHPEWYSCEGNPCQPTQPHVCCVGQDCYLVLETECAQMGGVFHPGWNSCEGNPCNTPPPTHVCCVGETCYVIREGQCTSMGGVFHADWDSCSPNPCRLPHVCCIGETCQLLLDTECAAAGGVFHPTWNSCTPNPCRLPHVCCVGGTCSLVLDTECAQLGGVFHPDWNSCTPNPCVLLHVCCVGCQGCCLVLETECAQMGGVWHPEWDSCDPQPCDIYTPAEPSSWGAIKAMFRR